jgi:hypothetical protein
MTRCKFFGTVHPLLCKVCIYITVASGSVPQSKALEKFVNQLAQTAWICAIRRPAAKGLAISRIFVRWKFVLYVDTAAQLSRSDA